MIWLLAGLALSALGTFASILVPSSSGRLAGFLMLGASGIAVLVAATHGLFGPGEATLFGAAQSHVALRLDSVSGFFLAVVGFVAVTTGLYGLGPLSSDERRSGRAASASACAIFFATILACVANDIFLFIFAWEMLALTFYWAIAYSGTDDSAARAAYLTIVVTHVAGACIVAALLVSAHAAGGFSVQGVVAAISTMASPGAGVVLILLLVGFGAKFGLVPMHVWMPHGYRAAPSVVTALMAGGALNVGFYGVTRFVVSASSIPLWVGIVAILAGSLTAFLGILWASAQRDLRSLAALSSVENGGLIMTAFGVAMVGGALHNPLLQGFAVAAAFVQIAAHAVAKSTFFLSISAIGDACETRSLDRLGGIARKHSGLAVAVLLCGMSLAALPPLAGFVGEWLIFEALMQAFRTGNVACEVTFTLAGALVALAAGTAVVTFTKVLGIGVFGAARMQKHERGAYPRSFVRSLALVLGSLAIVGVGIDASGLLQWIAAAIDGIANAPAALAMTGAFPLVQPTFSGFSSISPAGLGVSIVFFSGLFWVISRLFPRPTGRYGEVWTSGESYRPWTQYSGTGFVNPTRVIFDVALRTVRTVDQGEPLHFSSNIRPLLDLPFYRMLVRPFSTISRVVRATQSGVIAAYLSYILAFTIALLLLFPSIRRW